MILLVSGWRKASNLKHGLHVRDALDYMHNKHGITAIVQGECYLGGIDRLASNWAEQAGIPCIGIKMNSLRFGKSAGPIRNQWMIDFGRPDMGICFVHKESVGTVDMINKLTEARIPFHIEKLF